MPQSSRRPSAVPAEEPAPSNSDVERARAAFRLVSTDQAARIAKSFGRKRHLKARVLAVKAENDALGGVGTQAWVARHAAGMAKCTSNLLEGVGATAEEAAPFAREAGEKVARECSGSVTDLTLKAILDVSRSRIEEQKRHQRHSLRRRGQPLTRSRQHRAAPARARGSRRNRTVSSNSSSGDSDPGGESEPPERGQFLSFLTFLALVLHRGKS